MNMMFAVNSDVLVRACQNTIMGIAVVFGMLLFISFIISLFGLLNKAGKKEAPVAKPAAPAPVVEEPVVDETDDLELVAVITAAIHAYEESMGNDIPADALVVRSIKKRNNAKWQKA